MSEVKLPRSYYADYLYSPLEKKNQRGLSHILTQMWIIHFEYFLWKLVGLALLPSPFARGGKGSNRRGKSTNRRTKENRRKTLQGERLQGERLEGENNRGGKDYRGRDNKGKRLQEERLQGEMITGGGALFMKNIPVPYFVNVIQITTISQRNRKKIAAFCPGILPFRL